MTDVISPPDLLRLNLLCWQLVKSMAYAEINQYNLIQQELAEFHPSDVIKVLSAITYMAFDEAYGNQLDHKLNEVIGNLLTLKAPQ